MPANTMIIRTNNGEPLPPEVLLHIKRMAAIENDNTITYENATLSNKDRFKNNFTKRIKSATRAYQLMCYAIQFQPRFGYSSHVNMTIERFAELNSNNMDKLAQYVGTLEPDYLKQLARCETFLEHKKVLENYLQHLAYLSSQYHNQNLPQFQKIISLADQYVTLTMKRPVLATVMLQEFISDEGTKRYYEVQMEIPQPPFNDEMMNEYINAKPGNPNSPEWYKILGSEERLLFDYVMREVVTAEKLLETVTSISSKHRTGSGVANFSLHRFALIDSNSSLVCQPQGRYRAAILSSRDIPANKIELRRKVALQNAEQFLQNAYQHIIAKLKAEGGYFSGDEPIQAKLDDIRLRLEAAPILYGTLISPTTGMAPESIGGFELPPDTRLYEDKQLAMNEVQKKGVLISIGTNDFIIKPQHVFETNHPLNGARHLTKTGGSWQTSNTKNEALRLAKYARTLSQSEELLTAINDLEALIKKVPSIIDSISDNQREFHLAMLEVFIMERLPDAIILHSCVSNKDRMALLTMGVDNLDAHYFVRGKLPKYDDSLDIQQSPGGSPKLRSGFVFTSFENPEKRERTIFNKNYAEKFYASRHQDEHASLNASGAAGVKTVDRYQAANVVTEIVRVCGKNEITEANEMANTNELHKQVTKELDDVWLQKIYYINSLVMMKVTQGVRSCFVMSASETVIKPDVIKMFGKIMKIIESNLWDTMGEGLFARKVPEGIGIMRRILSSCVFTQVNDVKEESRAITLIYVLADYCRPRVSGQKPLKNNLSTQNFYRLMASINDRCGVDDQYILDQYAAHYASAEFKLDNGMKGSMYHSLGIIEDYDPSSSNKATSL